MNEIDNIMQANKINIATPSKLDRDINFYESELLANSIKYPHKMIISQLAPEFAEKILGNGQFSRDEYALSWEQVGSDSTFRFMLTNTTHSNTKLLATCPDEFKKDIVKLLPTFIQSIATAMEEALEEEKLGDTDD